jgi:hypothetical protein
MNPSKPDTMCNILKQAYIYQRGVVSLTPNPQACQLS